MCFIRNEYREPDINADNCLGLAGYFEERARDKQLERINVFLQDPATKFHEAATKYDKQDKNKNRATESSKQ